MTDQLVRERAYRHLEMLEKAKESRTRALDQQIQEIRKFILDLDRYTSQDDQSDV